MKGDLYKLDLHLPSETALLPSTIEVWNHLLAHIQTVDIELWKNREQFVDST